MWQICEYAPTKKGNLKRSTESRHETFEKSRNFCKCLWIWFNLSINLDLLLLHDEKFILFKDTFKNFWPGVGENRENHWCMLVIYHIIDWNNFGFASNVCLTPCTLKKHLSYRDQVMLMKFTGNISNIIWISYKKYLLKCKKLCR